MWSACQINMSYRILFYKKKRCSISIPTAKRSISFIGRKLLLFLSHQQSINYKDRNNLKLMWRLLLNYYVINQFYFTVFNFTFKYLISCSLIWWPLALSLFLRSVIYFEIKKNVTHCKFSVQMCLFNNERHNSICWLLLSPLTGF
jgi:hypothetical protein